MDIEEFTKKVQPKAKRSKLEPFLAQISELRAKGYTNGQVCEFLAANGVQISIAGLSKYTRAREQEQQAGLAK